LKEAPLGNPNGQFEKTGKEFGKIENLEKN
jgi:hypothetical protein